VGSQAKECIVIVAWSFWDHHWAASEHVSGEMYIMYYDERNTHSTRLRYFFLAMRLAVMLKTNSGRMAEGVCDMDHGPPERGCNREC